MSFPIRSMLVATLLLAPAMLLTSSALWGDARAASSPGSIMPQQGAAYDDLVNQTPPYRSPAQEGREGYIGTHVDPATGDVITDVVSPRMPQQQQQQVPIYIQPRIDEWGGQDWQQGSQQGSGQVWRQGSHRTQRQHGNRQYGNRGHGPQQPGFGVTHPGQAPSGHPGGATAGGVRPQQPPHVSGNSVQHPGYSQFGGNPGNMGNYMPQGRR